MIAALKRVRWITIVAALGAVVACVQEAGDGPRPSTPETRAAQGGVWFERYCAACHGVSARGDGPVASQLTTPPADLTRIAARNAGSFDAAGVAEFIDGRTRVAAHGSPEMPVWGRALDDRSSRGFSDETRLGPGTILMIVEYLRSVQRP